MSAAALRPVATEDDRKRAVRDLAAEVVQALYRAIKVAQMHALDNEAVRRQLLATAEAIRTYSLTTGRHVGILFARGAVFFGGQPLRATRGTYEAAIELGEMLARCGGAELGVSGNLTPDELRAFVVAVVTVLRDPSARFSDFSLRNVRLRQVAEAALLRGIDVEDLDEEARIVRTYAAAVVVLRRFYEALGKGQQALPRRIKRIAQSLVDLSVGDTPAFLGVTHVQNAHDAAGRAVNSAILAVAMGRQLTGERAVLTRIALAAMMLDAGRPRAMRHQMGEGDDAPMAASLTEDAERSLPAGTAAVLTTLSRASDAAMARTVVTYEALWLPRAARLGPVYAALRPASLEARIVAMARAYTDLVTLVPGEPPMSPAAALIELDTRAQARGEGVERTMLRLVMSALGVLPPGTLVALTSGEVAVVVDETMRLRIVLDSTGGVPMTPIELDLGGDRDRSIAKIVGTDPTFSTRGTSVTPVPSVVRDRTPTPLPSVRATQPSHPPTTPPPQSVERLLASLSTRAPAISSPHIRGANDEEEDDVQIGVKTRMDTPVPPRARDSEPPEDRTEIMVIPPEHRAEPVPTPRPPKVAPASDSARRPPDARGTMVRAPLPQLLVHLLARKLSGTLVLRSASGDEHVISVDEGAPQRLRTTLGTAALGSLLTRRGYVTDDDVEHAVLRAAAAGELIGRQLVIDGLTTPELVDQALREQISERLGTLATLPRDTLYAFFGGDDRLKDEPGEPTPTDALAVIMATVRALADDAWMDGILAGLRDDPVKLHRAADPTRFCFTEEENEIVESLRAGWLPYGDILGEYAGREAMVRRVVYALAITRHVDLDAKGAWPAGVAAEADVEPFEDGERMSAPPLPPRATSQQAPVIRVPAPTLAPDVTPRAATPPPGPAVSRSEDVTLDAPVAVPIERTSTPPAEPPAAPNAAHDERRRVIETRAAELDGLDHYALLGIEPDASRGEVEQAYLAAVKTFHPDRIPEPLADLHDAASRIFVRLTDARATLLDAAKRTKYDASLANGGSLAADAEQDEVARVIEASMSFQKAEILLKRGDVAGAEKLAQLAASGDPQSSDHLALLGWLRAMTAGAGPLAEGLALLDRAIAANPDSDRALCFRGALLKRANRPDDSIRDFRKAADINPKNLDAVREVRLHTMRAGTKGASGKSGNPLFGGLFDKLKKK